MVLKKENNLIHLHRVPSQTRKPGKTVRHFPVREKSGNFEQSGKIMEQSGKNRIKYWKIQGISEKSLFVIS